MTFGHASYLVYTLLFSGAALGILWWANGKRLWKNRKVIGGVILFSILYEFIVDPFAEHWGAWFFTDEKLLGVWIGNFPVENVVFFVLVSAAIASATLTFVHAHDKGMLRKIKKKIFIGLE